MFVVVQSFYLHYLEYVWPTYLMLFLSIFSLFEACSVVGLISLVPACLLLCSFDCLGFVLMYGKLHYCQHACLLFIFPFSFYCLGYVLLKGLLYASMFAMFFWPFSIWRMFCCRACCIAASMFDAFCPFTLYFMFFCGECCVRVPASMFAVVLPFYCLGYVVL